MRGLGTRCSELIEIRLKANGILLRVRVRVRVTITVRVRVRVRYVRFFEKMVSGNRAWASSGSG